MTKIFNGIIVVLMIALITTFIVSAVSLQSKTDQILSSYAVRREELAARQQQIQDMIVSLNSTFQLELQRQQIMAEQLGATITQINNTLITPAANSVVTQPTVIRRVTASTSSPSVSAPSAPVVVSTPRVTSAS